MVLQNGFRVSLFNPVTNKSYKEIRKGNDTYIEATLGAQYFVDIQLVDHDMIDDTKHIQAHVFVDEHDLGYRLYVPLNGARLRVGLEQKKGDRALAFAHSRLDAVNVSGVENGSCSSLRPAGCSQVNVCFHEVYDCRCRIGSCPLKKIFKKSTSKIGAKEFFSRHNETVTIDVTASQRMELNDWKVIRSVAGTATIPCEQELDSDSSQETSDNDSIDVTASQRMELNDWRAIRSVAGTATIPCEQELDSDSSQETSDNDSIDVTASQRMELNDWRAIRSVAGTATIPCEQELDSDSSQETSDNHSIVALKKRPKPKKTCRGRHLATITLNYCSAADLIIVGALEKPDPDSVRINGGAKKRPDASSEADDKVKESITTYHDNIGLAHQAILIDLTTP